MSKYPILQHLKFGSIFPNTWSLDKLLQHSQSQSSSQSSSSNTNNEMSGELVDNDEDGSSQSLQPSHPPSSHSQELVDLGLMTKAPWAK